MEKAIDIGRITEILKNAQKDGKVNDFISAIERIHKSHPSYGKSATIKAAAKELGL